MMRIGFEFSFEAVLRHFHAFRDGSLLIKWRHADGSET
jgi:hypothetical protein